MGMGGWVYKQDWRVNALEVQARDQALLERDKAMRINTLENNYKHIKDSLSNIESFIEKRRLERNQSYRTNPTATPNRE